MAWTQAQLDELDALYASGATSVSHDGKSYSLRSVDEYLKLRNKILAELRGGGTIVTSAVAVHSRD